MAVWHFAETIHDWLTMGWTRVLIDEWWEKAELYRKYGLYVWRDSEYGPCEVRDKWVFVADGLAVPEGLHLIRDYSRRLETWLGEMGDDEEYLVVKNQAELDELAAEWAAAQPEQREKKVVREYESL